MNKAIKWGLIICVGLVVLVIATLLIAPAFIDIRDYKPEIEKLITDKTGRPFSIGDDLSLSLFPWAGVSFSDAQLGNVSGFAEKEFVSVKSFEVRVKLLPLISKNIQVKRFILNEPSITLVKNKDGRVNWDPIVPAVDKTAAPKKKETSEAPSAGAGLPIKDLTVGECILKNGSAYYIDHSAQTRKEITAVNLNLQNVSLDRPITLSFAAQLDKQPITMDGTIGPVGKDFKQATIPLDLDINALKALILTLKGKVMNPGSTPGIDLAVEMKPFSPRQLMAALDQPFPVETSDPKALDRVALKANLKGDATRIAVSDGILNLDESTLNFSLKASDFSRPNLAFDMNLDQINLDRYLPPKSEQQAQPAEKTAPQKAADYGPLRKLILDGRIKIGQLVASRAKINDLLVQIKAQNGIFNLDPLQLAMYQGNLNGKGNFNVQTQTPKSNMSLNVAGVQAGPLLRDVLEKDILEGITNAQLNLSMAGDNADTIKQTLNGDGQLQFNDGAIVGIDLASMIRNVQAAFGLAAKPSERPKTDFAELAAPFTITNGIFNTPQTSLKSPLIRVVAAGNANLVAETLDFRVEPKVVGTIKGQGDTADRTGLMVPVIVSGTFAKPQFRPDLAGVAKKQLEGVLEGTEKPEELLDKKKLEETGKGLLKGILNQ
ncbi:MAG: AsmA family protein [Deltaproteobacteria bacterium]|jgi:AsmA protein|nr:AsmA family protein [Deltaproteobacteria bacterium]